MAEIKELDALLGFTETQNSNVKIIRHNLCGLSAGYFPLNATQEDILAAEDEHLKICCQKSRTNL